VSVAMEHFSDLAWDEEHTQGVMRSFNAEYLVVYRAFPLGSRSPESRPGFLQDLAAGKAPPWLELAAENPHTKIYHRRI
jgi:hypothetical protein